MPRLNEQSVRPRRRAGFTLVELLVTLALLGVVGTIVSKMMLDQQRFYQQTNEQMGLRREMRTAMSMVPADIRSISSVGGDIEAFDQSSIQFRTTFGAAIVCAKPNTTTIDLPPLNMSRTTLTTWYAQPVVGDTLFAFRADSMGAGGDAWSAHRITSIAQDASLCPASPYTDAVLDAAKVRWRLTVTPAFPDSVKVGSSVRFTRSARYNLVQGASSKWYLGRAEYTGGGWGATTAIAGPFVAPNSNGSGGIRFAMYDSTGVAIAPGGNAAAISRIDLTLRGQGASNSGAVAGVKTPKDSIVFRIALRNRQ